ncbi:MAG: Fic family protein [Candidatus Micrarchaeota archaeon]|nr:Fic family protein [Candidatus Micrarchaeota archaeon]
MRKEEIIQMNKDIGESGTVINTGNLEFIVAKLSESKDVIEGAALLLFYIVNLHPFLEGNKRTAYLAAKTFLVANGRSIKGDANTEELIYDVATNRFNAEQVEAALKKLVK